jgi:hypothetical protein
MKQQFKYSITVLLLVIVCLSCRKTFLDTAPEGITVRDNAMNSVGGALNAVNGAYQPLYSFFSGPWFQILEITSDDAFSFQGDRPSENYSFGPTFGASSSMWANHYSGIARCNFVLDNINQTPFTNSVADQRIRNQTIGQAQFLRAYYYFNLVRVFGSVPVYTTEIKTAAQALKPRNSIQEVYAQIESDLNNASNNLATFAELNNSKGLERGRASKQTARALKAWVYLTQQKWQQAADTALAVINAGPYTLTPTYVANFQGNNELNAESIFEVQYVELLNYGSNLPRLGAPGSILAGSGGSFAELIATNDTVTWLPGEPVRTNGIIQDYAPADPRKLVAFSTYGRTVSNFVAGRPMEPMCYKYWNPSFTRPLATNISSNSGINFTIMRLADVYMIYAEAANEAGGPIADAINRVNQIRRRGWGLPIGTPAPAVDLSASINQADFRDSIYKERRREFCFEGKRWFDLNRWGILAQRKLPQGITVPAGAITPHPVTNKLQFLFPIPQGERDLNPSLTQNPGY